MSPTADGLLDAYEMTALWSDLDRGMRDHFLGMMDKYEISFRVDGGPAGVVSLVVERLPWNPPPYEHVWDGKPSDSGLAEIQVRYQLNTMPPGIPTWFIARSHRFTTNTHWRTGALLPHPDRPTPGPSPGPAAPEHCRAHGARTRARSVLLDSRRRIQPDPVPLPGPGDQAPTSRARAGTENEPCTELFDYEDLQRRLTRNPPRREIECRKSGEFVDVPQMLLGLTPTEHDATRAGIERLTRHAR